MASVNRWMGGRAALAAALVALLAACGGGNGDDGGGGRITDPAKVATATPIQGAPLFRIRGDTVQAPDGATTVRPGTPSPGAGRTYKVLPGDTCEAIGRKHGVTAAQIIEANRAINEGCTNLREDQEIRIPGQAATPLPGATSTPTLQSGRTYTVVAGDNCFDIAAAHNVSSETLITLNNLDPGCTTLKIGQVLKIP